MENYDARRRQGHEDPDRPSRAPERDALDDRGRYRDDRGARARYAGAAGVQGSWRNDPGDAEREYRRGGAQDFGLPEHVPSERGDSWRRYGDLDSSWRRGREGQHLGRGPGDLWRYRPNATLQADQGDQRYLDDPFRPSSGPYTGRGPKGYRRSDRQILEDACQRLERDGQVDATEIEVSAKDGVIRLGGTVPERAMKRRAEECVESVYGARDVSNELRVSPAGEESTAGSRSRWPHATPSARA